MAGTTHGCQPSQASAGAATRPKRSGSSAERSGVTKVRRLDRLREPQATLRDTLDPIAPRAMAVLDGQARHHQLGRADGQRRLTGRLHRPVNPRDPEGGMRRFKDRPQVWIERTDYEDVQ